MSTNQRYRVQNKNLIIITKKKIACTDHDFKQLA